MNTNQLITDTLCTGAWATVATTAAIVGLEELENNDVAGGLNAVSHIAFGDEAARHDEPSLKYTGTGFALNAVAVTGWAMIHELICGRAAHRGDVVTALASGAAVSAIAYVTDYHIVPKRLTPGFEKRLSNRSLFTVYSVLALSLAAGSLCGRHADSEPSFAG